jgi:pimeloyl-ACP methyl ester carboxylesterase
MEAGVGMRIIAEQVEAGVAERLFELEVAGDRVPGVLWSSPDASGGRPLVLMGHGGSQHKRVETLVARAHRYVTRLGFAVAAIDAPGHGERASEEERARRIASIQRRMAERRGPDPDMAREMAARAAKAVPEWQATLDALGTLDEVGPHGPVGYWGVSMGTMIGVPFVASEPRITAAVFGLSGLAPGATAMAEAAKRITIPVEFALQSDDELVPREAGLALFDAFGSTEKTMHLNPGGHLGIPYFEGGSWERFFTRHLPRAVPAAV